MVAIAEVKDAGRWRMLPVTICVVFVALNVMILPVLSQGVGSQTGPVSFMDNYESQSDAQHVHVLNNGQQVQLVLDEYAGTSQGDTYLLVYC